MIYFILVFILQLYLIQSVLYQLRKKKKNPTTKTTTKQNTEVFSELSFHPLTIVQHKLTISATVFLQ